VSAHERKRIPIIPVRFEGDAEASCCTVFDSLGFRNSETGAYLKCSAFSRKSLYRRRACVVAADCEDGVRWRAGFMLDSSAGAAGRLRVVKHQ
jgi:hypothetical protein